MGLSIVAGQVEALTSQDETVWPSWGFNAYNVLMGKNRMLLILLMLFIPGNGGNRVVDETEGGEW